MLQGLKHSVIQTVLIMVEINTQTVLITSVEMHWGTARIVGSQAVTFFILMHILYVQASFASHSAGIKKKIGKWVRNALILKWSSLLECRSIYTEIKKTSHFCTVVQICKLSVPPILQWPVVHNVSREVQEPDSPSSWYLLEIIFPQQRLVLCLWSCGLSCCQPAGIHIDPRKCGTDKSLWGCAVSGSLNYSVLKNLPKKCSDTGTSGCSIWVEKDQLRLLMKMLYLWRELWP